MNQDRCFISDAQTLWTTLMYAHLTFKPLWDFYSTLYNVYRTDIRNLKRIATTVGAELKCLLV